MTPAPLTNAATAPKLRRVHLTRLRQIYRSAGWPCHDPIEIDLLAAGCLTLLRDDQGRETLRPTPEGLQALAAARQQNQAALDAHDALVHKVAQQQQREGRLAWTDLSLRVHTGTAALEPDAPHTSQESPHTLHEINVADGLNDHPQPLRPASANGQWVMARPDVFSVRHTTVEAYLAPVVHEIKVSRADLMGDLRKPTKRAAYLGLAQQVYYVLAAGIAQPEEVPLTCGVIVELPEGEGGGLVRLRAAPARPFASLPFAVWMALARATPFAPHTAQVDEAAQTGL